MERSRARAVAILLAALALVVAARRIDRGSPPPAYLGPDAGQVSPHSEFARGGRLDVCRATATELELLPGVGPRRARAIVEHRRDHGLSAVEDLVEVRGIGPATLRRLEPYVTCRKGP